MLRNYDLFEITYEKDTQDRLEDDIGELTGYSEKYRVERATRVLAPNQLMAEAWVLNRNSLDNPKILNVDVLEKVDAVIYELPY